MFIARCSSYILLSKNLTHVSAPFFRRLCVNSVSTFSKSLFFALSPAPDDPFHFIRGPLIHLAGRVRVSPQRDADVRMAESSTYGLRVHSGADHVRGRRVSGGIRVEVIRQLRR